MTDKTEHNLEDVQAELEGLRQQLANLPQQLADLARSGDAEKIIALQQRSSLLPTRILATSARLANLRIEQKQALLPRAVENEAAATAALVIASHKFEAAKIEHETAQADFQDAKADRRDLEQSSADLRLELDRLAAQLATGCN